MVPSIFCNRTVSSIQTRPFNVLRCNLDLTKCTFFFWCDHGHISSDPSSPSARFRVWCALTETIVDAEMLYWLSNEPAGNATEPSAMEAHRKFLLFTAVGIRRTWHRRGLLAGANSAFPKWHCFKNDLTEVSARQRGVFAIRKVTRSRTLMETRTTGSMKKTY